MSMDSSQVALVSNRPPAPETSVRAENNKTARLKPIGNTGAASPGVSTAMPQARQFEVSSSYGQAHLVIYRIIDKETGDLVQQIPPGQPNDAAQRILQSAEINQLTGNTLDIES